MSLRERVVHYRTERDMTGEQAAARISAYLYGNIITFAALLPLAKSDIEHGHSIQLLLGVAVTTFLAHVFAEIVGHHARAGQAMTRAEIWHELRDSRPIATSALIPALLLAAAAADWLSPDAALFCSEGYLLVRLALVGFLVERLRSDRVSPRTLLSGLALAAVAAGIAFLKVLLGH
ncbi:hypothetical protein BJ973_005019 [Actinoplanes tereljensis]|uniref:Integral membrane protein n=1 Tax=Paractinoplanes tereljensis TaxID=571912 RepID=A0A919NP79_9ACTN|nr:hypothetical protein [Actinoplanes tereljensis]GIF21536.1 hypothetical protein Ate02nite_42660 [Actinoplanes tereljensis]